MNKTVIGIVVILLVIVGFLLVKNSDSDRQDIAEPIKIGVLAPLTGIGADFGEEIRRGVLSIPADEAFEFVFEDTACDNAQTLSAFQKLTEFDDVRYIVGPGCGSPQEVITPLLTDGDALAVVPSAASKALHLESGNRLFNIQYSLEDESAYIAQLLTDLGHDRVAMVTFQNAYSKTHADSFRAAYAGEIAADIVVFEETADIATEVLKIKDAEVDAIYTPDILFFFNNGQVELEQLGVSAPVFSTYIAELPAVRSLIEGVTYSFPADIPEGEGAVFGLGKASAELIMQVVTECDGDFDCALQSMQQSDRFDEHGVYKRDIILKKIIDGEPVIL